MRSMNTKDKSSSKRERADLAIEPEQLRVRTVPDSREPVVLYRLCHHRLLGHLRPYLDDAIPQCLGARGDVPSQLQTFVIVAQHLEEGAHLLRE